SAPGSASDGHWLITMFRRRMRKSRDKGWSRNRKRRVGVNDVQRGGLHFSGGAVGPPGEADASFHAEGAAGHVVAVVAEDERDPFPDFFGRSQPAPGEFFCSLLHLLLGEEFALAGR